MKINNWKPYALWIGLSEAVGLLSGLLSRGGTEVYAQTVTKPPLSPPGIVFPIVWTVLYALMGIGAARVYQAEDSAERKRGLNLFIAQLIVNFFWSLIFFNLQAFGLAFFWLLVLLILVIWMTYTFYKVDPLAGFLQIPYIIWLVFAAYLSAGVWILNG